MKVRDMSDDVEVDPELLRRAADAIGSVRDRMSGVADAAESALSAGSAPWGNDRFGSRFADGPDGFVAAADNVTGGTRAVAESLAEVETGQLEAADALEASDTQSAEGFD